MGTYILIFIYFVDKYKNIAAFFRGHGAPLMPAIDRLLNETSSNIGYLNIGFVRKFKKNYIFITKYLILVASQTFL